MAKIGRKNSAKFGKVVSREAITYNYIQLYTITYSYIQFFLLYTIFFPIIYNYI